MKLLMWVYKKLTWLPFKKFQLELLPTICSQWNILFCLTPTDPHIFQGLQPILCISVVVYIFSSSRKAITNQKKSINIIKIQTYHTHTGSDKKMWFDNKCLWTFSRRQNKSEAFQNIIKTGEHLLIWVNAVQTLAKTPQSIWHWWPAVLTGSVNIPIGYQIL